MRKTGMMLVGLFGILVAGGADAVYKCANVYKDMTCTNSGAKGDGWVAICGDGKTNTEIKGISVCGNAFDSVNVFVGTAPGSLCFCKMIKPAVTTWVREPTINNAVACSTNCDTACASAFVGNTDELRSTMINNIVR